MTSTLRPIFYKAELDVAGITLVPNTPDEIRDLTVEMMDRLDGTARYDDEARQARFKVLMAFDPLFAIGSSLGRDFPRQHAGLLRDEPGRQPPVAAHA